MSSSKSIPANNSTAIRQKTSALLRKLEGKVCKLLVTIVLFLLIIYTFLSSHPYSKSSKHSVNIHNKIQHSYEHTSSSPTNIGHIVFGIAGTSKGWTIRKHYVKSWWQPSITRGFLFFDEAPIEHLPWPPVSIRVRLYQNTSTYKDYDKHALPFAIKMVLMIADMFKAENNENVRWYFMADDDTVLFTSNLVDVLSRYDHRKYYYIGTNSESILANVDNSFEAAFGGAGFALSYPLAKALSKHVDGCVKRYPTLLGRDHILQSCVADLGVSLTQEKGLHQIDLQHDISGLLSAHPQTPLLSLHHLELVEPIFPSMSRYDSVNHLMKVAKIDQPRLLQQSVCYLKENNWTFSISWGYSSQIYEKIITPSVLQRPLQTFSHRVWKGPKVPFMFNTRGVPGDPCEAPHVFFLDSVEKSDWDNVVVTSYIRKSPRLLQPCSSNNHSADSVSKIRVLSPMNKFEIGSRRECCDVIEMREANATTVKLRTCMKDEIMG
ncbi:hypothetical protein DCAR_0206679 [Daucus carota subsp. sativus]|uniref:Uncharacterized protein n=1 Tax=Daucus carota subsp. sativus TaxID=79200 RepID=A0AAF0WD75_DAUCS|nr:hypothetical protein DCAR_0206679 [Daucus carota subsp. sativus]